MKRILYLLPFSALITGIYFFANQPSSEYKIREGSHLYQQNIDPDAQTGYIEAMEYYKLLAANQETGTIETWMVQSVLENIHTRPQRRLAKPITWQFAGPDNIGGRTRGYIIDRSNNQLRFTGGVSGGLYRSTNGGETWTAVNPHQENLNVSTITQTKDGVIYYGTGEGGFVGVNGTKDGTPGFISGGIFKSEDGGQTFSVISNTIGFGNINIIASDSLKPERLWVGAQNGLRYTDDKGATWTNIPGTLSCRDLQVGPDGTIFAYHGSNQVIRSTDGGATFINLTQNIPFNNVRRLRIAISPQDPNYIYIVTAINGPTHMEGLYRSTDKGETFELLRRGGSIFFNPISQVLTLQGQGNFDLCLTVDPENKDRVVIGGVQLGEWNNGEAKIIASLQNFPQNQNYIHADKHEFLWDYNTSPPTLICLTDGGMFHSPDKGIRWAERTRNYNTTQFFGLAANEQGHVIGGTQDNGTLFVNGNGNTSNSAVRVLGGDGFQCEISKRNPNVIFAESQYGNLRRSVNGGTTFAPIWDDRLTGDGAGTNFQFADFNAQFLLWESDTSDHSRLFFAAAERVWMAKEATLTSESPTWFALADATNGLGGGRIIDLEYTPDGGTLFISKGSTLYRVDGINLADFDTTVLTQANDIASGITLTNISGGLPAGRTITSINLDPNDPNRALITLGNYNNTSYVFLSENILDATPTYSNVSGNIPRFPVYDAIISSENPNYFVAATEFGIWASENGGTAWEEQNEGMARVATYIIRQYKWKPWEGSHVYIATHGAGFYRSNSLLTNVKSPKYTNKGLEIKAYPNPSNTGNITLNINSTRNAQNLTYSIIDLTGKVIVNNNISSIINGSNDIPINVSSLKSGNYIVLIKGDNINSATKVSIFN